MVILLFLWTLFAFFPLLTNGIILTDTTNFTTIIDDGENYKPELMYDDVYPDNALASVNFFSTYWGTSITLQFDLFAKVQRIEYYITPGLNDAPTITDELEARYIYQDSNDGNNEVTTDLTVLSQSSYIILYAPSLSFTTQNLQIEVVVENGIAFNGSYLEVRGEWGTTSPTMAPTTSPSKNPTDSPSTSPTSSPTMSTEMPSFSPTKSPSVDNSRATNVTQGCCANQGGYTFNGGDFECMDNDAIPVCGPDSFLGKNDIDVISSMEISNDTAETCACEYWIEYVVIVHNAGLPSNGVSQTISNCCDGNSLMMTNNDTKNPVFGCTESPANAEFYDDKYCQIDEKAYKVVNPNVTKFHWWQTTDQDGENPSTDWYCECDFHISSILETNDPTPFPSMSPSFGPTMSPIIIEPTTTEEEEKLNIIDRVTDPSGYLFYVAVALVACIVLSPCCLGIISKKRGKKKKNHELSTSQSSIGAPQNTTKNYQPQTNTHQPAVQFSNYNAPAGRGVLTVD